MDDPFDLSESAWRRRLTRRLAEERSLERARARAEVHRAATEFVVPPSAPTPRTPSRAQLNHLAGMRLRAHPARWKGVDATKRRAIMRRTVMARWAKTTPADRHRLALALNAARWHRVVDPKAAPGGGRYR